MERDQSRLQTTPPDACQFIYDQHQSLPRNGWNNRVVTWVARQVRPYRIREHRALPHEHLGAR